MDPGGARPMCGAQEASEMLIGKNFFSEMVLMWYPIQETHVLVML